MKPRILTLAFFLITIAAGQTFSAEPAVVAPKPGLEIPATDHRFRYEGRFDFADRSAPVVIWQASRISLDWKGEELVLEFGEPKGQIYFDAIIDGQTSLVSVCAGAPIIGATFSNLGAGRHHLVLFKRSEASAGTVAFRGVRIDAAGRAYKSTLPSYRLRMEFFGDSITVGACNEDGPVDQWEDRRTHNAAKSYATMTAEGFKSDYRNIAISGMGVVTGYEAIHAPEFWDRLYPRATSPQVDLQSWVPDVIFINLGENDNSFTLIHHHPFPGPEFTRDYIGMVHAIRAAYPRAEIILLTGGMEGGSQSAVLRAAWTAVHTELEAKDPAIAHFIFKHWSHNHPRVADDRAMADELLAWLREQSFMARWR